MLTPDAQALTKWHNNLRPDDLTTDCRLQVGLAVDRVYDAAKVLKNLKSYQTQKLEKGPTLWQLGDPESLLHRQETDTSVTARLPPRNNVPVHHVNSNLTLKKSKDSLAVW